MTEGSKEEAEDAKSEPDAAGEPVASNPTPAKVALPEPAPREPFNLNARVAKELQKILTTGATDEPRYYSTALHDLTLWTGAKHRLGRNLGQPFNSREYAREEIRADLSSLFLSADLGILYDPRGQAGYIQSWANVLKNDNNEVFRAAADAGKAADYILAFDKTRAPEITLPERTHVERLHRAQGRGRSR